MLGNVFTDLGDLVRYLGSDQPVYGLQDGIHNPSHVAAMAAHYLEEIRTVQLEGPYLLVGICSGGVVAFEMAQQLHAQGQRVSLLALVEPTPPYARSLGSYVHLAGFAFGRLLRRLGRSAQVSQEWATERGLFVRLKLKLVANQWALRQYIPRLYPERIHLFLTAESLASGQSPRLGWRAFAVAGVEVHEIPGTHNTITGLDDTPIEPAHMQALAERLKVCIDDVLPED